nr:hypothetical protein [Tanacetum cinerariifolium]
MNYQPVTEGNQPNLSAVKEPEFEDKKPEFEVEKPESEVYVSPSSSAKTKKHDNKTKREAKGKRHVDTPVPAVGQISTSSTNTFSAAGPSNIVVSLTLGESSYVDPSQYLDDPNMPALEDITYSNDEADVGAEADFTNLETTITVSPIPTTRVHKDHLVTQIIGDLSTATQTRSMTRMVKDQGGLTQINNEDFHTCMFACFLSQEEPKRVHQALKDPSWIEAMQEELHQFKMQKEEGIDYEEFFAPAARIEAIRLFLAYASFMGFMVYQMDVKSAFLYGTIEEEVYVDDIIFASTNKDLCKAFEKLMKDKFQMSSMGELTLFLGLQVKQKSDGIFISHDKYVALIDREKVIITEDTVQEALRLNDAESIDCLPNKEIFTELARMGYEKPSTKLTFYKAFFFAQWKFLIHTILQCMSAKRTAWNEFSSSMALAVICLATVGDLSSHTTKYSSPALTQKVFANMRRVGKGFSRVETPLFEGMLVPQQAADDVANVVADDVDDVVADSVPTDVVAHVAAEPTQPSPTPTTPPPPPQDLPSISQLIHSPPPSLIDQPSSPPQQQQPSQPTTVSIDLLHTLLETCTTLTKRVENLEQDKIAQALENTKLKQRVRKLENKRKLRVSGLKRLRKDDEPEPAELQEVIEVLTTGKLMTKVVTAATTTITAAPSAARRRKGVVIRDLEETATPSTIVHSEPKSKDKGKGIMFKGMSYDDIRPIFEKYFNSNVAFLEKTKEQLEEEESRALKRKTKSSDEKAVEKQKLDEEVEELKKHLQIVPNDDDDVYTKATPLALKVSIVDYEIHSENNKPYYKIIRADGSHQLFLSFLSLLRNFDREDW